MNHWIWFVLIGLAVGSTMGRLFLPARRHDARGIVVIAGVVIAFAVGSLARMVAADDADGGTYLFTGAVTVSIVAAVARWVGARGVHQPPATVMSRVAYPATGDERHRSMDGTRRRPGTVGRS